MRREILTDKKIGALIPDPHKEYHVWDSRLPGFGVRVRPSGHKTYVLFYRPRNRAHIRKLTLGRAEAIKAAKARQQAQQRLGEVAAGKDPAGEKLAYRSSSLQAAYDAFKAQHLPNVSREHARHRERIFERHFLPKLGDKVLREISRGEIKDIVDKIAKKYKIAACNAHRTFSAFLTWCQDRGLVEQHVLRGSKLPAPYRPRERTLSNEELIAIWHACDVWRWRGAGWRGAAVGAAVVGGALAARSYYGGYGYDYPAYSYGYGAGYSYPSYGYGSTGYSNPGYGYGYATTSYSSSAYGYGTGYNPPGPFSPAFGGPGYGYGYGSTGYSNPGYGAYRAANHPVTGRHIYATAAGVHHYRNGH